MGHVPSRKKKIRQLFTTFFLNSFSVLSPPSLSTGSKDIFFKKGVEKSMDKQKHAFPMTGKG